MVPDLNNCHFTLIYKKYTLTPIVSPVTIPDFPLCAHDQASILRLFLHNLVRNIMQ